MNEKLIHDSIYKYLLFKRIFIFLDEWLSYFILYKLFSLSYYLFFIASILAILFNGYAYYSYWYIEEKYNKLLYNLIE